MKPSDDALKVFMGIVWAHYDRAARATLPWRRLRADGTIDPYAVMVSEIMLQQTQVPRVVPKFELFMEAFPTVHDLAGASLADVLRLWSGLGYNRRAKFLWQAAGVIKAQFSGRVPQTREELITLPGIGANTAGAILAYAYNRPALFIETNIRSVYIHHFFSGHEKVSDADLLPLLTATIPHDRAREWYWALMDYGTYLKQTAGNAARASKTYTKQSAFHGSRRKIRGQVLKNLTAAEATHDELATLVQDERLAAVLDDLAREGFIAREGLHYRLQA